MLLFYVFSYEGEADPSGDPTPPVKTFTQEQVNEFNKKERLAKEAALKKAQETEALLDQIKNQHKMTEAEKEELAKKVEEYEQSKLTDEQKKQIEVEKLKKTFDAEKTELSSKLDKTIQNYHNLLVSREITAAALEGKIVAFDGTGDQVLRLLKQDAVVNEEGEVIIKNFTWTAEGKSVTEDLPAKEAVAKMKQMDSYANFWKDPANPGFTNHIPGITSGEIDVTKLTQAQYRKLRAEGKIPYAATRS